MRLNNHDSSVLKALSFSARLLAAASVICLPLLAGPENGPSEPGRSGSAGSGSPGNTVAGDETIGTLPAFGPDVPFDLVRYFMDGQANLVLQGNRIDVLTAILDVRGTTVATIQVLDDATDTVRYTFHGSPRIALDPSILASGLVTVGMRIPRSYGAAEADLQLGARDLATVSLTPGFQRLPVDALAAAGVLERQTFVAETSNATGAHTRLAARITRGALLLEQSH